MDMFRYLNYGLATVLAFVGIKMIGEYWQGDHFFEPLVSLAIILALLAVSIAASIIANRRERTAPHAEELQETGRAER